MTTLTTNQIAEIAELTELNNHNEARIHLAGILKRSGLDVGDILTDYGLVIVTELMVGHMPDSVLKIRRWTDFRLRSIVYNHVTNAVEVWRAL